MTDRNEILHSSGIRGGFGVGLGGPHHSMAPSLPLGIQWSHQQQPMGGWAALGGNKAPGMRRILDWQEQRRGPEGSGGCEVPRRLSCSSWRARGSWVGYRVSGWWVWRALSVVDGRVPASSGLWLEASSFTLPNGCKKGPANSGDGWARGSEGSSPFPGPLELPARSPGTARHWGKVLGVEGKSHSHCPVV